MHFEQPVASNALPLHGALEGTRVPIGVSAEVPPEYDARAAVNWSHPRADFRATVPTQLVRAVLDARKLMMPAGAALRVVSVPELCTQVAPVAYIVQPRDVDAEIVSRGPVLTTLSITPALLAYWGALLTSTSSVPAFDGTFAHVRHGGNVLGTMAVALVGFSAECYTVALGWGATTDAPDAWGWNGCMRITKAAAAADHVLTNAVAMWHALPLTESAEILVLPLTPAVLQQAVEGTQAKAAQGKEGKGKKVKVKATLSRTPAPIGGAPASPALAQSRAMLSALASPSPAADTGDKAVFVTLGVLCLVIVVLLSIFLATRNRKKKWKA